MANPLSRRLRTALFYALRTAFRLTPMPQITRDKLRQRFLDTRGHWVPEGPKGKMPSGDLPRRPYVRSDERAIGYVPYQKGELPDPLPATLVAFYLPQFHTIPENDEWWGKGFTEWRNVTRALPQFEGHYQPKLPGDLGFYDLRNVEVMHEQARLAREYGISAFCFYFYWFGGKTLLETPLRNWLNDKTIDLKFCLCWANEKWTRTWDGRGDEILIDQKHSPEDDIAFIEHVAEYMRDPRYLRVDGKPLLLVYRPGLFPDMRATAIRWRAWCEKSDVGDIQLAYVQAFDNVDPITIGFDAAVQFPPLMTTPSSRTQDIDLINPEHAGQVFDWREMVNLNEVTSPQFTLYPGVNPSWDNEARRPGRGRCFRHSMPHRYGAWLSRSIKRAGEGHPIFINAWNEWAEGAALEPDLMLGHAYLRATRRALTAATSAEPHTKTAIVLHAWYLDVLDEILQSLREWKTRPPVFVTCSISMAHEVEAHLRGAGISYELRPMENRGRDILPFLKLSSELLGRGFELVLKLHTKKSPHLRHGAQWRRDLVHALIGDEVGATIQAAFAHDSRLGIVGPADHLLPVSEYLGANGIRIEKLISQLGIEDHSIEDDLFVSGSMFWVRLEAIRPLLESTLQETDFEPEAGQIDGTLAHAIERLFAACALAEGYLLKSSTTGSSTGRPVSARAYPYARSD